MGRKSKVVQLTSEQRAALEQGYRQSKSAAFSRRCHIILLKSQGRTSEEIGAIIGTTIQPVNRWVKRFEFQGMEGLQNKPGQGRKAILNRVEDEEKVRKAIQKERQRLGLAKEELEQELDKEFSLLTLKRFLKKLSADGNESG